MLSRTSAPLRAVLLVGVITSVAVVAACGDNPSGPPPVMVSMLTQPDTMLPTDSLQFSASVAGGEATASKTIAWRSSNTTVLTIDANGLAVALASGQATVSASSQGVSASAEVTVIDVQLAENTVVADGSLTLTSDSASMAQGNLEFQNTGNVEVEVGDVLIGSDGDGFVRRVETVTTSGTTIAVTTVPASLPEAVEELAMDIGDDFTLADAAQAYLAAGPDLAPLMPQGVTLRPDGTVEFNNATFNFGAAGPLGLGGAVSVSITGSLDVLFGSAARPGARSFKIGGKIKWFKLKRFTVKTTARMVFNATATATVTGNPINNDFSGRLWTPASRTPTIVLTKKLNPATGKMVPGSTCTSVGPIPVCYKVTLKLPAYVEMWASGPGTVSATVNIDIGSEMGGRYRNGAWEPIFSTFGPGATVTSLAEEPLDIRMRFGVVPQIEILFYEFAGPYLGLDGWTELTVGNDTWEAYALAQAGLDLTLGLRASVWGITLADFNRSYNLWATNVIESRTAVAGLRLSPNPLQVQLGAQGGVAAEAYRLSDGASLGTPQLSDLDWITEHPTIATVNAAGVVSGVEIGSTRVQARLRGTKVFGNGAVNVTPDPIASLNLSSIEAEHVVGATGCPQTMATLEITNISGAPIGFVVAEKVNLANLSVGAGNRGTGLAPGSTASVRISFTCSSAESFEGTVLVKLYKDGGRDPHQIIEIPVTLTVVFPEDEDGILD